MIKKLFTLFICLLSLAITFTSCGDEAIDVENVKIQNIELPQDMKRAMAKQAEAERERRSNIINAEGEKAAAETLAAAARIIASTPGALNLRTLNTIERISTEPSQKTTMLFPIELVDALRGFGANGHNK